MARSYKKDTIKLSFDQKERALSVLRTLIRCHYFGNHVPHDAELSRLLRIPRSSLILALNHLMAEGLITSSKAEEGWDVVDLDILQRVAQVAFVVNTDPLHGWFSLFQDWLIGFEQVFFEEGYQTRLLCSFSSVEEKIQKITTFREEGGMACVLASRAESVISQAILEAGIPSVVMGNCSIHLDGMGSVCSDNIAGANQAVDFLAENNHRLIYMYVTGLNFHHGFVERYMGYQQAMKRHHLVPHTSLAFNEPHSDLSARRAADMILRMKHRPSALLCGSDREAFEIVSELRHLGIHVPQDISVVGFDNNHYGSLLEPPMTTIDIFAVNMGQIAAHYLLNEMQSPQLPVKIQVPTELVIRSSVLTVPGKKNQPAPNAPYTGDSGRILNY